MGGEGTSGKKHKKIYRRHEMLRYKYSVNAMVLDTSSSCVYGHCSLQAIYLHSSYVLSLQMLVKRKTILRDIG